MESLCFEFLNQHKLPLVIQPRDPKQATINTLTEFLKEHNASFKEQLLCYGAILLRGFHIHTAEHLSMVVSSCDLGSSFDYGPGLIPRTKIIDGIHRITNIPEFSIPMHNEKSYSFDFPSHIYFNCIRAAKIGGNTPLADGHKVWISLPDALQHKLSTKGILYRKFYYGESIKQKYAQLIGGGVDCETWMGVFRTDSKNAVEQILHERQTQFRWLNNNGLVLDQILPAYRNHPKTNKLIWFNQSDHLNYYDNYVYGNDKLIKNPISRWLLPPKQFLTYVASYGDGEPISKSDTHFMSVAIQKNKISIPWQEGDVLVIDNYLSMHGKESHSGDRLILVGMTH